MVPNTYIPFFNVRIPHYNQALQQIMWVSMTARYRPLLRAPRDSSITTARSGVNAGGLLLSTRHQTYLGYQVLKLKISFKIRRPGTCRKHLHKYGSIYLSREFEYHKAQYKSKIVRVCPNTIKFTKHLPYDQVQGLGSSF